MPRRRINQIFDPILTVEITATKVQRLVYLLVANRPLRYGHDYSRIVYIGTTERGVRRIAYSSSRHIIDAGRRLKGVRRLNAYVIWTKSKAGPQTKKGMSFWRVLERAVLLRFCQRYGRPPRLNRTGQRMKERHEFKTFSRRTIDRVINRYT